MARSSLLLLSAHNQNPEQTEARKFKIKTCPVTGKYQFEMGPCEKCDVTMNKKQQLQNKIQNIVPTMTPREVLTRKSNVL